MDNTNLFPVDIDSDIGLEGDFEGTETEYKKAPYFDSVTGDFLMDGSGSILDANEIETYIQWCEAIIATNRYKCDAYTTDIGIDYDSIFSASTHEEAETILESEISEALLVDPCKRTNYVQNVSCEWVGSDEIHVLIEVVAFDNEIVTIDTVINK